MNTYVETPNLKRMDNALHAEYHHATLDLLRKHLPADAPRLEPALTRYEASVAAEVEHLTYVNTSDFTADIRKTLAERDAVYRSLLAVLGTTPLRPTPEIATLSHRAHHDLLHRYTRSICSHSQAERTSYYGAFVSDLHADFWPLVEHLGIAGLADRLDELNQEYLRLYTARNAETTRKVGRLMLKARTETDTISRAVATYVGAIANLPVADGAADDREPYRRLIGELNELTRRFRITMRR